MKVTDPASFKQSVAGVKKGKLIAAMTKEMDFLVAHDVFYPVPPPTGKHTVRCQWHLKTKYNTHVSIDKQKARLVARGLLERNGIDYH